MCCQATSESCGSSQGSASFMGTTRRFSDSTLDSLYRDHLEYFGKVLSDSDALVVEGFWLAPDAQALVQKARNADVP